MVMNPKCSECTFCVYVPNNDGCNRYYCNNPAAMAGMGGMGPGVVCRRKRHTKDNIKTSPK